MTAIHVWATVELSCANCATLLTARCGSQFFTPADLSMKTAIQCGECGKQNIIPAIVRRWAK